MEIMILLVCLEKGSIPHPLYLKTESEWVIKPGQTHPKNAAQNSPTIKFIDHAAIASVPCATRNNRISMSRGVPSHIITNYHKKSQLSFWIAIFKM